MPNEMYEQVAARKKQSMTQFVIDAVQEKLERDRREEMRKGFESLADDFDADEFALWNAAQRATAKHIDD
jgi:hypothetical protein